MKKKTKLLSEIIVLLLLLQLCGCRKDKDFTNNDGFDDAQQTLSIETEKRSNEQDTKIVPDIIENDTEIDDPAEVQPDILRVENKNVYFNDISIVYDQKDTSTLMSALKEKLSACNDETELILDLDRGDDEICNIVENAIRQMGMTASVQSGDM